MWRRDKRAVCQGLPAGATKYRVQHIAALPRKVPILPTASIWSLLTQGSPTELAPWLAWHPEQLDACIAARGEHLPAPLDAKERESLNEAHRHWGADEASLANIEKLGSPRARVVVTGQQPGVLLSPILVLYKTLEAIALCRQLSQRHPDLDWVPVFWVASEDHDFEEIRHVWWQGKDGELSQASLPTTMHRPGQMVGDLIVEPVWIESLLERLAEDTHPTEFREPLFEEIEQAYAGQTIETGFCRLLLRLLRGMGLVIISPTHDWVRRRALPIVTQELKRPGLSTQRVLERTEALEHAHFTPGLHRPEGAVNLFRIDDHRCRRAMRPSDTDSEAVRLLPPSPDEGQAAEVARFDSLLAEAKASPDRFSFNVVTRPMVQDSLLPTVAQVVGPGEAAYLAQVEAAYEDFGVFRPVRWPRPQITLLEPRVQRQLKKLDCTAERVATTPAETLGRQLLLTLDKPPLLEALETLKDAQLAAMQAFEEKLSAQDRPVQDALGKLKQATEKGHATLEERITRQHEAGTEQLQRAIQTVSGALQPLDRPQERVISALVPFAQLHGLDYASKFIAHWPTSLQGAMQYIDTKDFAI